MQLLPDSVVSWFHQSLKLEERFDPGQATRKRSYWMFEGGGVWNVRSHAGYRVHIQIGERRVAGGIGNVGVVVSQI